MRKKYIFGKKLYISVLTSILVLLTTVATTFAWVGVFANSTFEQFDFNLKSSHLEEYGIEISLSGKEGTFSDSISGNDIKKAILLNWGYTEEDINYVGVNDLFTSLNMEQCTTVPTISSGKIVSLGPFKTLDSTETRSLFKFDVYVSATQFYDSGNLSTYKLDVYLNEGLISGNVKKKILLNPFTYSQEYTNPLSFETLPNGINPILANTRITSARVNSRSVCRVGFEKYEVVNKYHPEEYTDTSTPVSAIIYTGDKYNHPTYDSINDVYEFGGILEDDQNLAVGYYNSTEWWYSKAGIKSVTVPSEILETRGVNSETADSIFNSNTNHLIDSSNLNEQIGVNQMMKVTVSFWIEGWDSDCFNAIGGSPVTISISMSTTNEEAF